MQKDFFLICILSFLSLSCNTSKVVNLNYFCNNNIKIDKLYIIHFTGRILYDKDLYELSQNSKFVLLQLIQCLRRYDHYQIIVHAYYCNGSPIEIEYVYFMIDDIMDFLVSQGIEKSKINFAYNYDKKKTFEDSSSYRRVEVKIKILQ